MKNFILSITVFFLLMTGCNNTVTTESHEEHTGHDQKNTATAAADSLAENHEGRNVAVQLDNGKKWVANPETKEGINRMQSIVRTGITANAEPASLIEPLKKEFQTIFEKCTMKGEAHEQLHNYLVPVKDYLKHLEHKSMASRVLSDLEKYLMTFGNYFE